MRFFDKMEKKLGKYAIRHLTLCIIVLSAAGFIVYLTNPDFYELHLCLDMERIFAGEVWRLVTFLVYPLGDSFLWFFLELFIIFSLGTTLERLWGTFYYNLYIFLGVFFLILASLLIYLIGGNSYPMQPEYLHLTLVLAFAMTLPDMQFLLFFTLPVKAKYLAFFYLALIGYRFYQGSWPIRVSILASLGNTLVFFLMIRNPARRVQQAVRKNAFDRKVREAERAAEKARPQGGRHVCCVCGRTDKDNPELEFRFCSKCSGNREYCLDHLYTHVHVKEEP